MSEIKTLNVADNLRGMTVLASDTAEKLGAVVDAIIHPTEGRVLGIIFRTLEGEERVLETRDFFIGADAVMATGGAHPQSSENDGALIGGVAACREMVGTNVVTEDGKLLGRVREVYISAERPQAVYRVAESTLQRFFGGGFFLAGDVPRAYSRDGARMIVPADTADRHAASSVLEALDGEEGRGRRIGRT